MRRAKPNVVISMRCNDCGKIVRRRDTNLLYKACPHCPQVKGKAGWTVIGDQA